MKKTAKTAAKTATTKPEAKKCCAKKCAAKKCETKKPALKSVTFTVHAEAGQDVRLAGSFTDWETKAKKMTFKKANGIYSATVKLAPGEYQYKFIIGGDIAAAATAGSSSSVSEGNVSLVTDTLSSLSEGESLEGRFCTWFVSVGGALRSDSWRPYLVITVR